MGRWEEEDDDEEEESQIEIVLEGVERILKPEWMQGKKAVKPEKRPNISAYYGGKKKKSVRQTFIGNGREEY